MSCRHMDKQPIAVSVAIALHCLLKPLHFFRSEMLAVPAKLLIGFAAAANWYQNIGGDASTKLSFAAICAVLSI